MPSLRDCGKTRFNSRFSPKSRDRLTASVQCRTSPVERARVPLRRTRIAVPLPITRSSYIISKYLLTYGDSSSSLFSGRPPGTNFGGGDTAFRATGQGPDTFPPATLQRARESSALPPVLSYLCGGML